jgi:hypothetical protein
MMEHGKIRRAFAETGLPRPNFKVVGARRIDALSDASDADIIKAFEGLQLTPSGHFLTAR